MRNLSCQYELGHNRKPGTKHISAMNKEYTLLLRKQVEKLGSDNFDLEAWKSATMSVLTRIFGPSDSRILQIEGLKIDYGSWALRDAQGSYNPLATCKKKGEELLEAAISELEILGLPENEKGTSIVSLISSLEDELKVSQIKSLKNILNSDQDTTKKQAELVKAIESWGKKIPSLILAKFMLQSDLEKHL